MEWDGMENKSKGIGWLVGILGVFFLFWIYSYRWRRSVVCLCSFVHVDTIYLLARFVLIVELNWGSSTVKSFVILFVYAWFTVLCFFFPLVTGELRPLSLDFNSTHSPILLTEYVQWKQKRKAQYSQQDRAGCRGSTSSSGVASLLFPPNELFRPSFEPVSSACWPLNEWIRSCRWVCHIYIMHALYVCTYMLIRCRLDTSCPLKWMTSGASIQTAPPP